MTENQKPSESTSPMTLAEQLQRLSPEERAAMQEPVDVFGEAYVDTHWHLLLSQIEYALTLYSNSRQGPTKDATMTDSPSVQHRLDIGWAWGVSARSAGGSAGRFGDRSRPG